MVRLFPIALALMSQVTPPVTSPILHRRNLYESQPETTIASWNRKASEFPQDATGFYRFRDRSQGVQIQARSGELYGFLLKQANGKSDKGRVLGYYFSDVTADRDRLQFNTRQVHGVWYAFEGRMVLGSHLNPLDPGYYLLEGTLTMHDEARQMTQRDSIKLPLSGQS